MDGQIYFPILRGKSGEAEATACLSPRAQYLTCPTFDLALPKKTESLEQHVCGLVQSVAHAWGTSSALCLDMSRYGPEIVTDAGHTAIEHAFECARQCRLQAIPVGRPMYLQEPTYLEAIRRRAGQARRGHPRA